MTLLINSDVEPLDICPLTVTYMLQLGTVNEIVKHQPDNVDAIEKKVRLENELKAHLSECVKCANALKDE